MRTFKLWKKNSPKLMCCISRQLENFKSSIKSLSCIRQKKKKTVPLWYLHFTATLPKFKQSCYLFIFFQLPWSCKHITTRDAPFGLNSYFKFKYKICKYSAASKRTLLLTKHFYFKIFLIPKIMLQQKAQNYCSINCGIVVISTITGNIFHKLIPWSHTIFLAYSEKWLILHFEL